MSPDRWQLKTACQKYRSLGLDMSTQFFHKAAADTGKA
jgi:hypothetical protein